MFKKVITVSALSLMAIAANAQNSNSGANVSASASQTVKLDLSNAIDLTFVATGKDMGNDVELAFNTVNDYANGVESKPNMLMVRSNKDFGVTVKTASKAFSYSGRTEPAPVMPIKGILNLKVSDNSTSGEVASPFSEKEYASLYHEEQKLIVNGKRGGKQTFAVQYKATPGFEFPAGVYTVGVVYTATQQ